ncbi:succinate dehydrogenase assembly factor 2 [Afifella sp. JA880]|uniref:FAD assembly factor SdhE n=1 Tax=unclassified Afifella TaxID=2624128 RepID=UPI0021BB3577|nr:succinate dehydrogenase assembly factor 2 [Afifella sp. JA880]MCT8265811.1 succinate dehydrogenase assembly factor 2 [Afifella sp. JA880]
MADEKFEERRRRAHFRAWRRGTRELDLLVGRFGDSVLPSADERQLAEFERLLELPDLALYSWIVGREEVPAEHQSAMISGLIAFHKRERNSDVEILQR